MKYASHLLCFCALATLGLAQTPQPPTISPGGIVNAASFALQPSPLAPGSLVSIFGTNLAPSTAGASGFPLPTTLNGTTITFTSGANSYKAPLILVSAGQINAQIPYEVAAGTVSVSASSAAGGGPSVVVTIANVAPALFTAGSTGYGAIAGTHADNSAITATNPAKPGEVIILYGTGFGALQTPVPTGAAATAANQTRGAVTITIGGRPAPVAYAGITPGFAGLYQVNVTVPAGYQVGDPLALVQAANAQGGGRTAGNPVSLGTPAADGSPRLLAFPAPLAGSTAATQTLGAPVFLAAFPTLFLAFDGAGPCYTNVNFFAFQSGTTGTNRPLPAGVACVGNGVTDQLAIPVAAGQPANPPRMLFPTFPQGGAQTTATGFLSVDPASSNATPLPLPATLAGDSYDAAFLNNAGTTLMVAPGRSTTGKSGSGMLVLTNTVTMRSVASPSDAGAQFFGGNQQSLDNANQILYTTAGAAAAGPFFNLVALNLKTNTSSSIAPPLLVSAASPERYTFDLAATPPVVLSVSADGTSTAPAYNVRVYNLQSLAATAIALPATATPVLANTTPVYFYNATDNIIEIPTVSAPNLGEVTGFQLVDLVRQTPKAVALPPGVTNLSEISSIAGTIYGLMNATSTGGAPGLASFEPANGNFTIWPLPKSTTSSPLTIGRGQAGKSAQAGAARQYLYVPERQVIVAPASQNADPTIVDAGLVVFSAGGVSSLIGLPQQVLHLHATGNLFYKPETNRVWAMGDASATNANADVLVWFDLRTHTSGAIRLPAGANSITSVTFDASSGMAIATTNANAKGYAVWQLP